MPNYTSKRRKPDHLIVENDESPYRVFTRDDLLEQLIKENLIQENGILSFADQYLELPDPPKGTPCSSSIRAGIPALRLQFQELLVRVRYPCGYLVDEVESGLQELKQVIENIPCREGMPVSIAQNILKGSC